MIHHTPRGRWDLSNRISSAANSGAEPGHGESKRIQRAGLTLVELMVASAVLGLLLGLAGWLGKTAHIQGKWTEKNLELLRIYQEVIWRLENDLYSAQRHTLGNALTVGNASFPGFDGGADRLAAPGTTDTTRWSQASRPLTPDGSGTSGTVYIDELRQNKRFGEGSLAIAVSGGAGRIWIDSPSFQLPQNTDYVLAAWARAETQGGIGLTSLIELLNNGSVLVSAQTTSTNWVYISTVVAASALNPGENYTVRLSASRDGTGASALIGRFDCLTVTPSNLIADLAFNGTVQNMIFFRTNTNSNPPGSLCQMVYTMDNLRPVVKRRFLIFGPPLQVNNTNSLNNVSRLQVSWVGDPLRGANRPIQVDLTVQDPRRQSNQLTLSRFFYPPTD